MYVLMVFYFFNHSTNLSMRKKIVDVKVPQSINKEEKKNRNPRKHPVSLQFVKGL